MIDRNTIYNAKRFMGRRWADAAVSAVNTVSTVSVVDTSTAVP
jgi:molecular chaperone DnaK (HSP70)